MFLPAATLDELWIGEKLGLVVAGVRVLLVHLEGGVFAFADACPHKGVPLSDGKLQDEVLICRAHEWQYDARSGCGINPQDARLRRFPVRIEGQAILVDVEGAP
jgi:toluene monooxygenase system ferredoxin subunit